MPAGATLWRLRLAASSGPGDEDDDDEPLCWRSARAGRLLICPRGAAPWNSVAKLMSGLRAHDNNTDYKRTGRLALVAGQFERSAARPNADLLIVSRRL